MKKLTLAQQQQEIEALKAQLAKAQASKKFGTWTSEKSGKTFIKVKVSGLSRNLLLSRDAYNDLADMIIAGSLADAIDELDID